MAGMAATLAAEIASAAARLVVDEGLEYGAAKYKAARQLQRRRGGAADLPGSEQVEDEVRAYLQLFCAETQPGELRALRRIALRWMDRLAEFRPHLGGAVWRGTATRQSSIQLDLYCDDPKGAEIALINLGIGYEPAGTGAPGETQVLTVADDGRELGEPVTLHLLVRDHDDLRGALKPDSRGRSWRGDAAALRRLLEAEAAE
jgi:hypothetical protein